MEIQMNRLMRFRVDPRKIRIRVRPIQNRNNPKTYRVRATNISGSIVYAAYLHESVTEAIMNVLDVLSNIDIDGVNTDLMTAYPHPQFKE